jgi:hypothetical protein
MGEAGVRISLSMLDGVELELGALVDDGGVG